MSTINTNVNSMISQRVLGQQNQSLNNTLQKLSTGLRINSGKDDPSGLIASENLRSEKTSINAAIDNAERADNMLSVAEGGLKEVNSQLLELQSLVTSSANDAGLSEEEKEANQQEVDAILNSIDRIANTTNFQGQKLLNGNFDFETQNQSGAVDSLNINRAATNGETLDVQASVTASAQRGGLFLSTGGALDLSGGNTNGSVTFDVEVAGAKGSKEFSFTSGTTQSEIADAINGFTAETGVSAATSGTGLRLDSTGFGSDEFVSVDVNDAADINAGSGVFQLSATDTTAATGSGTGFASVTNAIKDSGQDIGAIINGQKADSDGRVVNVNTDNIDAEVTVGSGGSAFGAQSTGSGKLFDVTGGGAKFNIGGEVNSRNSVEVTTGNVQSRNLGSTDVDGEAKALDDLGAGGDLNVVDGDMSAAQNVVDNAIKEVSQLRGRLGSLQKNTIQPTVNNLNVALENTAAAESNIRDTDFAKATSELTRSQILRSSAQNSLSIANSQPRNALSLLQG